MTTPTLDNLTPAQLRDLATRANNAAAAQEKAAQDNHLAAMYGQRNAYDRYNWSNLSSNNIR